MQMFDIMDNQTFAGLLIYIVFCGCKFAGWAVEQLKYEEEEISAETNRR
jgi:hypothetical protein